VIEAQINRILRINVSLRSLVRCADVGLQKGERILLKTATNRTHKFRVYY